MKVLLYLLSFGAFVLALGGLSVGVLAGRSGIRGSCGGLNTPDGCGVCGRSSGDPGAHCPRRRAE
jgi:hypothetical protein